MLCYPASAAFDRISTFFPPVFSRNGADPWIGRRVPELLRQAGLEDIGVQVTAQAYPPGTPDGPSGSTSSGAFARRSWRWG